MARISRLALTALIALVLIACSGSPTAPKPDPLSQSSAVSVAMPDFKTSDDTTLRWRSQLIWVDDPEGQFERRADMLQNSLQVEFERKGYQFVGPNEQATYDVLAVAVLGDLKDQTEIEQIFRLYPSLASNSQGYTPGNVLVAIAPIGTTHIVWRGALEVFSNPGMQPIEVVQKRMQWAARALLASIPNY
ncbi:MAG: hypothetical protein V7709_01895 [Halioglobus sp.]